MQQRAQTEVLGLGPADDGIDGGAISERNSFSRGVGHQMPGKGTRQSFGVGNQQRP
jgi:hypothetical protein